MKLTCPHCALPALSPWRKLALGPMASARCRQCGLSVSTAVPQAMTSFAPSLVALVLVLMGVLPSLPVVIGVAAAGWAVTSVLYLLWVPLVARQVTRQDAVAAARARHRRP